MLAIGYIGTRSTKEYIAAALSEENPTLLCVPSITSDMQDMMWGEPELRTQ